MRPLLRQTSRPQGISRLELRMTDAAKARAEYDFERDGVTIYVRATQNIALSFNTTRVFVEDPAALVPDLEPLRLELDVARAVYEALSEFFGGSHTDARMLRRDYDAERKRVDKMLEWMMQ